MTLLERLEEFNAGNVWDFNDLGLLVKALPALIEVAEAAKVVKETYSAVMSDPVASDIDAEFGCLADAWNRLNAALAKLEVEK
jgi:hypothetical protein